MNFSIDAIPHSYRLLYYFNHSYCKEVQFIHYCGSPYGVWIDIGHARLDNRNVLKIPFK